jgi:radical SAM protein with 4Fe4S-binding SPASM domain
MSVELFNSIIDQFRHARFFHRKVDLTGVGEPLLNPDLIPMVKYAKDHGFEVSFTSNFTIMNQSIAIDLIKLKLDCLCVSVDAGSKKTFDRMRSGADFDAVTDHVKMFLKTREAQNSDSPRILIRSTISEDNAEEAGALISLAEELGVDGILFFPQLIPGKGYFSPNQFKLHNLNSTKLAIVETSMPSPERRMICRSYTRCYITFDGSVIPCPCLTQLIPQEQYSNFEFGNLRKNLFADIWFSTKYKQFRAKGVLKNYYLSICDYCPYSSRNVEE